MSGKKRGDSGWVRFGDIAKLKPKCWHPIHRINANKDDLFWFECVMLYDRDEWVWFSIKRTLSSGKIEGIETTATKQEIDDIKFIEKNNSTKTI